MLWMIYVILHRLYLVNEQNAMINMKKDMVKKSRNQTIKKNSIDFDLEKVGSLQPAPKHPFLFKRDINVREEEEVTFPLPQNRPQQAVADLSLFQLNKSSYMSPSLNV